MTAEQLPSYACGNRIEGCRRVACFSLIGLWPFGSFPEAGSVIGQAFMTMLPSLVLGHMIFAKCLAAIFTLLVLLCYTSAFVTFVQIKPTSN
jgi:hypothetical protein